VLDATGAVTRALSFNSLVPSIWNFLSMPERMTSSTGCWQRRDDESIGRTYQLAYI
jgi:hypothetical protein